MDWWMIILIVAAVLSSIYLLLALWIPSVCNGVIRAIEETSKGFWRF